MILKILIGFALGYIAACVTFYILQKRERRRRKEKKKKVSLNTYAKVATTAVLAHGMILTSCSYVLSWIGMDPVVDRRSYYDNGIFNCSTVRSIITHKPYR